MADELKIDQVAFATVPAGEPWTKERVADPTSWDIQSSYSPVANTANGEFDFGKLDTVQQRRALHEWLPISNLLLQRLTEGDDAAVDLVATAVLSNGARQVLVWPARSGPEPSGTLAFISPSGTGGPETWRELTDSAVKDGLGFALWERVHPADPELQDAVSGLFHQLHTPNTLSGGDVLDVAPEMFRAAAEHDSLISPTGAVEAQATTERSLEQARAWHSPMTEPTKRVLALGRKEYLQQADNAVFDEIGRYLAVGTLGVASLGASLHSLPWFYGAAKVALDLATTMPPAPGFTPLAFAVGGVVAAAGAYRLPEAVQRIENRFRRRKNWRFARWAKENLPAAGYSREVEQQAGERLPLIPQEDVTPGQSIVAAAERDTARTRRWPRLRRRK